MDEFEAEGLKLRALIAQQKNGSTRTGPSKLSYAIAYARRGMRVFPCHHIESDNECSCGKLGCSSAGKHPRHKGWQEQATTDEDVIRQMWAEAPEANVGVACGEASGITVLDVDGDLGRETLHDLELANGELPLTPIVLTPSGGMHLYFLHEPGLPNAVRFAPGLDVRNDGGLVIGAGSRTKRAYEPEVSATFGEVEVSRMRPWLADLIRPAIAPTTRFTVPDLATLKKNTRRNDVLYRSGRSLRAQGLPVEVIRSSLIATNAELKEERVDDQELNAIITNVLKQPDRPGFGAPAKRENTLPSTTELPVETFDDAVAANERYLQRTPVIEGLCYSSAVSMITGGKHSGKSTLARWEAVCVVKGREFLGRQVQQGPVIYLASEDEEMVARSELMRLGWTQDDPLYFIGRSQIPDDLDEAAVLVLLTDLIKQRQAVLTVVDMLFDFIPVRDELGYAETRKAVGLIQEVASRTSNHLVVLHHAPKHMPLSADAAITALGSQGLAARVSPIILTGRYGPGVHSIVSTSVRDPRGNPLKHERLLLMKDGSLGMGGTFKAFMLAEVYADRVLELIQEEQGQEFTVNEVMEKLGLDYEPARATLKHLYTNGKIDRSGTGKKRDPLRYFVPLTDPPAANTSSVAGFSTLPYTPRGENSGPSGEPGMKPHRNTLRGENDNTRMERQGRFGYKDDDLDEYGISKSK